MNWFWNNKFLCQIEIIQDSDYVILGLYLLFFILQTAMT